MRIDNTSDNLLPNQHMCIDNTSDNPLPNQGGAFSWGGGGGGGGGGVIFGQTMKSLATHSQLVIFRDLDVLHCPY